MSEPDDEFTVKVRNNPNAPLFNTGPTTNATKPMTNQEQIAMRFPNMPDEGRKKTEEQLVAINQQMKDRDLDAKQKALDARVNQLQQVAYLQQQQQAQQAQQQKQIQKAAAYANSGIIQRGGGGGGGVGFVAAPNPILTGVIDHVAQKKIKRDAYVKGFAQGKKIGKKQVVSKAATSNTKQNAKAKSTAKANANAKVNAKSTAKSTSKQVAPNRSINKSRLSSPSKKSGVTQSKTKNTGAKSTTTQTAKSTQKQSTAPFALPAPVRVPKATAGAEKRKTPAPAKKPGVPKSATGVPRITSVKTNGKQSVFTVKHNSGGNNMHATVLINTPHHNHTITMHHPQEEQRRKHLMKHPLPKRKK